ncbi:hypothetical protein SAMD00023353_0502990 [Rosellinia necatrix]|uniref:Uncharacterized protein n=1 Tax=Rosellinia necatrix TaxID=77044 RepID=A0A1S7UNC3_ROSNE|nr:hypothetical protein SAMD00023353_0502990 [Rosellinia necatrix]
MSTAISPWVINEMAANPGVEYKDLIPQCKTCGFTFHSYDCPPVLESEGNECLFCANIAPEETVHPCCWGSSHEYSPIPIERSNFTTLTSRLFCDACYDTAKDSPLFAGGEPHVLPARPAGQHPYPQCRNKRTQRFYNSLIPLQEAPVRVPGYEGRLKDLLLMWLNYLLCNRAMHPLKCLNCYCNTRFTEANPFCPPCRNRRTVSSWHGYQACGRCHLFKPVEDFIGVLGDFVTTCDPCRGKQRDSIK